MRKVIKTAIQDDPQISNLLSRMPAGVSQSFTEEQLGGLKIALASRQWGQHKVDLRGTFKWFHYRYYFVFLAGKNRRELSQREQDLSRWVKALIISGFMLFSWIVGLLSLYLIKSALGINLIDNFSLGIWDWFKTLFA